MRPIVFDLYCGLGGWSAAFIEQGYLAIGFDIEAHDYGNGGYPGALVLRDIRSIDGGELVKQYGVPACIVASPPCQEFSYMAMPWSKAKEKMRKILSDPAEQTRLTDLFNQCFRIQREVSAASGRYVPMVVENVRGAQRWVGKARWNFGSFYLWGDVPALMPIPAKIRMKGPQPGTGKQLCASQQSGLKLPGNNSARRWEDRDVKRLCDATKVSQQANVRNGHSHTRHLTNQSEHDSAWEGVKGFTPNGEPLGKNTLGRKHGSKSKARKQASAEIAKIPPALASWIAKCFKPQRILDSTSPIAEKQG